MRTEHWPFRRGAEPSHKWAEIASREALTRHLYDAHYRSRRLTDGMVMLLKWHRPEHANAAQSARFRSEYRQLQSLNVAGAAKPLALIDERGCLTMPLEDFAGESLEAVLSRESRMDLPLCLSIARHLADALV